jgi:hypothetical protein
MTAEIANWIVTGVTATGLIVALWQLFQNNKIAGQAHAREAWMRYLEHGFQHPEYGSTDLAIQNLDVNNIHDLWNNEILETERYWWFLDIMMESCESLVKYFPQKEWKNTIQFNLRIHADAIKLMWDGERHLYSNKLCNIVDEVLAETEKEINMKLPYTRYIEIKDKKL